QTLHYPAHEYRAPPSSVVTAPWRGFPGPAPTRAARRPGRERVPSAPPAEVAESATRTVVAQRNDSVLRSLRARATAAMSRAVEAGATPAELAKGDTVFKGADSLAAQSRWP